MEGYFQTDLILYEHVQDDVYPRSQLSQIKRCYLQSRLFLPSISGGLVGLPRLRIRSALMVCCYLPHLCRAWWPVGRVCLPHRERRYLSRLPLGTNRRQIEDCNQQNKSYLLLPVNCGLHVVTDISLCQLGNERRYRSA